MNAQRFRIVLQVSIGLLAAGTLAALAWAFLWPLQPAARDRDSMYEATDPAQLEPPKPPKVPGPEEFGMLAVKPLQQELNAELILPPGQRQVVLKVPIPPSVQLLATMVEPDRSAALFSTADGAMLWCRVGENLGEATPMEVVSIEPAKVVVRYLGQESVLEILAAGDG